MKARIKKASASNVGTCRLCLQTRKLCRSHMIPESAFKPSYNASHRAHELTVDKGRHRAIQIGYRERLLCEDCEQRLNKYDDYFAEFWFQSGSRPTTVRGNALTIAGLDYNRFKLFHMSVLWRAGVSSLPQFKHVRLDRHAERLRKMLLADDPGEPLDYPFWAVMLNDAESGHVYDGLVMEPEMSRAKGHTIYTFTFGGCCWFYFASVHPAPEEVLQHVFDRSGALTLEVRDLMTYTPLIEAVQHYLANSEMGLPSGPI